MAVVVPSLLSLSLANCDKTALNSLNNVILLLTISQCFACIVFAQRAIPLFGGAQSRLFVCGFRCVAENTSLYCVHSGKVRLCLEVRCFYGDDMECIKRGHVYVKRIILYTPTRRWSLVLSVNATNGSSGVCLQGQ
jgi:hypothetical protein